MTKVKTILFLTILISNTTFLMSWNYRNHKDFLAIPDLNVAQLIMKFKPLLAIIDRYKCDEELSSKSESESEQGLSEPTRDFIKRDIRPIHDSNYFTFHGYPSPLHCLACSQDFPDEFENLLPHLPDGSIIDCKITLPDGHIFTRKQLNSITTRGFPGYIKFIYSDETILSAQDARLLLGKLNSNPRITFGDLLTFLTIIFINIARENDLSESEIEIIGQFLYLATAVVSISSAKNMLFQEPDSFSYKPVQSYLITIKEVSMLLSLCLRKLSRLSTQYVEELIEEENPSETNIQEKAKMISQLAKITKKIFIATFGDLLNPSKKSIERGLLEIIKSDAFEFISLYLRSIEEEKSTSESIFTDLLAA